MPMSTNECLIRLRNILDHLTAKGVPNNPSIVYQREAIGTAIGTMEQIQAIIQAKPKVRESVTCLMRSTILHGINCSSDHGTVKETRSKLPCDCGIDDAMTVLRKAIEDGTV